MDEKLRQILASVFNLETSGSIRDTDSLIADLGADSLDFVELLFLIEQNFGVVLKADEIMLGGSKLKAAEIFDEGKLTSEGAKMLKANLGHKKESIKEGMGKVALFSLLTVGDLASIIRLKMEEREKDA